MFFYKELSPLVIVSNVATLQFSNIAVNASSSMTFTVSAASGEKTETVTLADNTNQFEFSPSSFSLGEGGSQVVTVTYRPTVSGPANLGSITVNSSGGSSTAVSLTGSATRYTRIAVGTALANSSAAGNKLPANPPNGSEGWYFKNSTSTPTSDKKFNYYFFATPASGFPNTHQPNEIFSASMTGYFVASFPSVSTANANGCPFISIYTVPQGAGDFAPGFYRSKKTYALANGTALSANLDYLFYTHTNPNAHQQIPANRRIKLTLASIPAGGQQGPMGANEQISFATLGTNSAAALNTVEVITRNMGVEFTDRLDEIVCLKSGSV